MRDFEINWNWLKVILGGDTVAATEEPRGSKLSGFSGKWTGVGDRPSVDLCSVLRQEEGSVKSR